MTCGSGPANIFLGAFTDAKTDRKGLFEVCSSGTLFLDEIGELTPALQSKLLRILQDKMVTPLGSAASTKVGTRIVAATNRNLQSMVKEGRFRRDLYYRLSVLQIDTPALRDHPEDIMELTDYFLDKIALKLGRSITSPSPEIMARLVNYEWPGNVRELQNALERAIILSKDGTLDINDIFLERDNFDHHDLWNDDGCVKELSVAKEEFEKHYLEQVLALTKGNVARTAKIAGRIRTDMYRLFSKYEIDHTTYK